MNFILIGFKSSGKSALGKSLAKHLGMQFIDTDIRLESLHHAMSGKKENCRSIYQNYGAEHFRHLETTVLASLLWTDNAVISTGGGAVLEEINCRLLSKAGLCVFLNTDLGIIKERLGTVHTPLFNNTTLEETYACRLERYREVADVIFPVTTDLSPEDLARELAVLLHATDTQGQDQRSDT